MNERATSPDAMVGQAAATTAALAPWRDALADLKCWFADHGRSIWREAAARHAEQQVAMLTDTLGTLARGEDAIGTSSRARDAKAAAVAAPRIDALLAGKPVGRATTALATLAAAEQRRKALLNLALWDALRGVHASDVVAPLSPLSRLHARLADLAPLEPGLSPAFDYAQTPAARDFFEQSVRRVLQALARRCGSDGASYVRLAPKQPFDARLPSLVAWSQAWSAAVAGVYLDYLQRHAEGDPQRALWALWSGQLDAVRFRAGVGLTALPAHAGSLHFDLWTCAVKAQALAFDAARWPLCAAGTSWHGVRIDMHELGHGAKGGRPPAARGLSVETLYRVVFVDRLNAVIDGAVAHLDASSTAETALSDVAEHTIVIEMDRPRAGHLPNLKLMLRWRDPSTGPLRFTADDGSMSVPQADALHAWLASQGQAGVARLIPRDAIDWRSGGTADGMLGHGAFWPVFSDDVQWIDPALVVSIGGAWYELPVDLRDEAGRTWWMLYADVVLPSGIDRTLLVRAASGDFLQWMVTNAGLGAFVMAVVDVDAWRRAQHA